MHMRINARVCVRIHAYARAYVRTGETKQGPLRQSRT